MLVAGNWKANGSLAQVKTFAEQMRSAGEIGDVAVAVCPPAIYLPSFAEAIAGTGVALGAQNVCDQDAGAYTGEISGDMLAEFGCRYAIVGHSERRHLYGESDGLVAARFVAAQRHGLTPILCVGETLEQREAARTESVVESQVQAVLSHAGAAAFQDAVVAYEPVWAIGTGRTASPEQAQDVHAFIRALLRGAGAEVARVPILYGGSVKPDNAGRLFAMPDIDGGLIGGASLKADDFISICRAAADAG